MKDPELEQWGAAMADLFEADDLAGTTRIAPVAVRLAQNRVRQRSLEAEAAQLVSQARAEGLSWDKIGRALDMTSEGARKKYGP